MNTNSNLGQNLASGGALLPICGMFMFLSASNSDYAGQVARIGIDSILAMACILHAVQCVYFIRSPKVGHDALHGYMLVADVAIAGVNVWGAWKWAVGANAHLPLVVTVLYKTSLVALMVYQLSTRQDLQNTFIRSEEQGRRQLHKIENQRQKAVLFRYQIENSLDELPTLELTTDVGRRS